MDSISVVQKAITAVLVSIAVALAAGELLGQPLLLGYVATGSMEPTLAVGDGFIALPPVLTGGVSTGDVITYEAQTIGGGGPTTHRVIGVTDQGYITQGDANAFTDQEGGEPPVTDAQVYAVVLQLGGEVVVLPGLGSASLTVQNALNSAVNAVGVGSGGQIGLATTGFGIVLIVSTLIYGFFTSDNRRLTDRSTRRSSVMKGEIVLASIILLLALPIMTSMILPSGTTTNQLLSVSPSIDTGNGRIVAGDTVEYSYDVENNQYVPKVVIIEPVGSGLEVINSAVQVSHGERKRSKIRVTAPAETGTFARSYSENHYIYVLPIPLIELLHAIHPFIAKLVLSVVSTTPVVAIYVFFIGIRPISLRETHR